MSNRYIDYHVISNDWPSLKSSSCHTMLDSPTFLYVIILFITIEIMYYYQIYLLYLLYTNNICCCGPQPQADNGHTVTGMRGWCTSLSLPNVTAAIIQTVLTCLTGLFIGLVGWLTGLTELMCVSLAQSVAYTVCKTELSPLCRAIQFNSVLLSPLL